MDLDYGVFEHQVAGCHKSNPKQLLLTGGPGKVLKPYKVNANKRPSLLHEQDSLHIPDAAFDNEKDFYEKCFSDATLDTLKKLIPRYFGEEKITINDVLISHVIIEDITYGFKRPCIADVKMGTTFNHPGSTLPKIQRNLKKYPSHKELGWCIAGLQRHSLSSDECKKFGPDVGKTLSTEQTKEEFKDFLCVDSPISSSIVEKFLGDVEAIHSWFKSQRLYLFIASSLLFTYDAPEVDQKLGILSPRCKMIDFAHVLKAEEEEDSGYLFGLENLLKLLKNT